MLFSTRNLIRLMLLMIIILAMLAGFYKTNLDNEKLKNHQLESRILNK